MNKQADKPEIIKDVVGAGITPAILGPVGAPITGGGSLVGAFAEPEGYKYFKDRAKSNAGYTGLIPGVGSYHIMRRNVNTNKHFGDESPRAREVARYFGGIPGSAMTLGLADLTAAIASAITARRTDEEQRKASTSSKWKYLIPGYGTYDYFKTQGKSSDLDAKAQAELEEEKNKQKGGEEKGQTKDASYHKTATSTVLAYLCDSSAR